MKTTLNKIRKNGPCSNGWAKLLKHLGKARADDDELDLLTILESNGFDDALWCLRAVDGFDREKRLFAVWCARQVEHLNPDPRVKACNDMAERYANSLCTIHDLDAARYAARYAAEAVAWAAARYAAAEAVAWAAARYAALAAARYAAEAAARYAAAGDAAGDAAWAAAWAAQEKEFRRMLLEGYP